MLCWACLLQQLSLLSWHVHSLGEMTELKIYNTFEQADEKNHRHHLRANSHVRTGVRL